MKARPGLGYQDYADIMENNIFYVDKTDFIREWWENADKVTLITRPRRFGKTLNMSTVECFFSNKYASRGDLFEGRDIWKEERYRQLQGTFPVIFLSFANVKAANYEGMVCRIAKVIADLYNQYDYLLKGDFLNENEREYYKSINYKMGADKAVDAIHSLACFLQHYYGKNVIILLDEYDTPMQEAWTGGYWDRASGFFRGLFNSTFKTNPYLYRGLITGITRISKESIFSDMNNLIVVSAASDEYATCFGFTEKEVFDSLDDAGLGVEKEGVKRWYDGFTFGQHTDIYNPWSIVSFIKEKGKYKPYWSNTSGNELVSSLIQRGDPGIKQTVEDLLDGKSFRVQIDEQFMFSQLADNTGAVWSLLLATGYLKVLNVEYVGEQKKPAYTLSLTNMEVWNMFDEMVRGWFGGGTGGVYNDFIKALLLNDVDSMNEFMNDIALQSFSNFDMAKSVSSRDAPERFYHGFVLGLIVELAGRFEITSNRESGFGRYDVMLEPTDHDRDDAYIIEFKVHKPHKEKNLEETVANAHIQIEGRQYETVLVSHGIAPERIRKYGFAFRGKECLIG